MEVFDLNRRKRATISCNGEVINIKGETLGYINEDGNAGDSNEVFLGEVSSAGQVIDTKDNVIGKVDLGNAEVSNAEGGHFFTVSRSGDITDSLDGYRGTISEFTYHKLRVVVAYIYFFDTALVDPRRPSKVVTESQKVLTGKPNIRIRSGVARDVAILAEFNLSGGNSKNLEHVQAELILHISNNTFLVAEIESQQVGYLLWENSALGYKNTWYFEQVVVKEEFRKKGIATALLLHFLEIAKNAPGIGRILSMVQSDNTPSIKLHLKSGFKISGNLYMQEGDLRVLFLNHVKS